MWKQSLPVLVIAFMALFSSCTNPNEEPAARLYQLTDRYSEKKDYDRAIKILQRININYPKTQYAKKAEEEIAQYLTLQKLYIDNQRHSIQTTFSGIGRALENYKIRFLAYPLTKKDLEKLPAVVIPEWDDAWGNPIFYKPLYSSENVLRRAPDGYALASFGADSLPGGTGMDGDYFYKNGKPVANEDF